MTNDERDKWVGEFKRDISDRASEVDPGNEFGWFELSLGYFIGKGVPPQDAFKLATHIRYHTELG